MYKVTIKYSRSTDERNVIEAVENVLEAYNKGSYPEIMIRRDSLELSVEDVSLAKEVCKVTNRLRGLTAQIFEGKRLIYSAQSG